MYKIIDNEVLFVIEEKTDTQVVEIATHYGFNPQLNKVSDTEIQTIYEWQKFNLDTGIYETDTSNNTPVTINGTTYTPVNGQVVVQKA